MIQMKLFLLLIPEFWRKPKNRILNLLSGGHIANLICICYNAIRQKGLEHSCDAQKGQTPGSTAITSGGFPSFTEKSTVQAWLPTIHHLHQATCTGSRLLHWPIWREQRIGINSCHAPPSCHQYRGGNIWIVS